MSYNDRSITQHYVNFFELLDIINKCGRMIAELCGRTPESESGFLK